MTVLLPHQSLVTSILLSCDNHIYSTTQIPWPFPDFGPLSSLVTDLTRIPQHFQVSRNSRKVVTLNKLFLGIIPLNIFFTKHFPDRCRNPGHFRVFQLFLTTNHCAEFPPHPKKLAKTSLFPIFPKQVYEHQVDKHWRRRPVWWLPPPPSRRTPSRDAPASAPPGSPRFPSLRASPKRGTAYTSPLPKTPRPQNTSPPGSLALRHPRHCASWSSCTCGRVGRTCWCSTDVRSCPDERRIRRLRFQAIIHNGNW